MVKNARTIAGTRIRCMERGTNAIIANSVPRVTLFNVLRSPSILESVAQFICFRRNHWDLLCSTRFRLFNPFRLKIITPPKETSLYSLYIKKKKEKNKRYSNFLVVKLHICYKTLCRLFIQQACQLCSMGNHEEYFSFSLHILQRRKLADHRKYKHSAPVLEKSVWF